MDTETEVEFLERKLAEVQEDLGTVRDTIASPEGRGGMTALTQLHRLELDLAAELRAAQLVEADDVDELEQGGLQHLLRETRKLRAAATAKGSMVPASRLLEREQSILKDIGEARRQAAERERLGADEEALLMKFGAAVDRLPEQVVMALYQRLALRLSHRLEG